MRILGNVTKAELDGYVRQPTAKVLHDRVMKDSVYVPEGDEAAAAVYVAGRGSKRVENRTDAV